MITLKGVYAVSNTFLYLCVHLISIGLEIKLRYNESCIDGSLHRGPTVLSVDEVSHSYLNAGSHEKRIVVGFSDLNLTFILTTEENI